MNSNDSCDKLATEQANCVVDDIKAQAREPTTENSSPASSLDTCLICYEDVTTTDELETTTECPHAFCQTCLQQHVEHAIFAQQLPVPCPCRNDPSIPCSIHLSPRLVQAVLLAKEEEDDETDESSSSPSSKQRAWKLYQRLEKLRADPTLQACPWCDALVHCENNNPPPPPPPRDNSDAEEGGLHASFCSSPDLSCPSCQRAFCVVHGSAHAQETCHEYLHRLNKTPPSTNDDGDGDVMLLSEQVILRATVACSHCRGRIQKAAGCDHVVCPACRQDMCYRCGTHEYLTGKVIRICGQCHQGYVDHRYEYMYRLRIIIFLPLLVPAFMLYSILMIVLAILTIGFGCCFGGGRCLAPLPTVAQVEESSLERAVRFGLAVIAVPFVAILRDLGVQQSCRLPHEIYFGLRAGSPLPGTATSATTALPEIPTMHVVLEDDVESPTNSSASESNHGENDSSLSSF